MTRAGSPPPGPRTLFADPADLEALRAEAGGLPFHVLDRHQAGVAELLMNGGYAPLDGFMDREAFASVVEGLELPDGTPWPVPVGLEVDTALGEKLSAGERLALQDEEGATLALLAVSDVWRAERGLGAMLRSELPSRLRGSAAPRRDDRPGLLVGGRLTGLASPARVEDAPLHRSPGDVRRHVATHGWSRVLAVHTRGAGLRGEMELARRVAAEAGARILLLAEADGDDPFAPAYQARIRGFEAMSADIPRDRGLLTLLPPAAGPGGLREVLRNALVARNFGGTHFALPGASPGDAQDAGTGEEARDAGELRSFLDRFGDRLGIEPVPCAPLVYVPARRHFLPVDEARASGEEHVRWTWEGLAKQARRGEEIPEEAMLPGAAGALRRLYRTDREPGLVLFFTGLSGAGKSTLARSVGARIVRSEGRRITLLDGDVVRRFLSRGLGFSREDRDLNVLRIGFVASEIAKHGGIAICSPIAPYAATRAAVRARVETSATFVEVHVAASLEVCEGRDTKGLYARARRESTPNFTGVSDPYETPESPELRIDTERLEPGEAAEKIIRYLRDRGHLTAAGLDRGSPS